MAAGSQELPGWFLENRVQGHTRLVINHVDWGLNTPAFQNAGSMFKQLGAGAFTRQVKTCFHNPWWPTQKPADASGVPLWDGVIEPCNSQSPRLIQINLAADQNIVEEIVADAHGQDLKLIAYYWHMSEEALNELSPQGVFKESDCITDICDPRNGSWLDISEANYRQIVLQRLIELAGMGVDGFYFDHIHMPLEGGWCSALANAFKAETGSDPPVNADFNDRLYRKFLDFKAYKIEETFAQWESGVKNLFPDVVFVVSATGIPVPHNHYETTNLVRLADSTKNEYKLAIKLHGVDTFFKNHGLAEPNGDIRQAFGWVLMRDSADGRPPHIWERAFPNRAHGLAASAAMVTYGTVANMNVDERILAGDPPLASSTPLEGIEAAFQLGSQVSPYLAYSRPLHWAGIHFSELARNRRGADLVLAWQEVLWPAVGAFSVFVRSGLPVGLINDYQLEKNQLEGYRVLFLPNPDELTRAQKNAIRLFVARGGILIKNNPEWLWSDPLKTAEAARAFRLGLSNLIECLGAPVQVISSARKMHGVAYEDSRKRRLVVAVTNDYSWVQWLASGEVLDPADTNPPPGSINDAQVFVKFRKTPASVFEVLSGNSLVLESIPQGYKVRLPDFQTLALLVVQE